MKKYIIVLLAVFIGLNINAQGPDQLFKQKYAILYGDLRPDGSVKVTKENLELYRQQYERMDKGLEEIEKYEYDVDDGNVIFLGKELKELEKDYTLDSLRKVIDVKKKELKKFLGENSEYGISKEQCQMTYSNLKQSMKRKDYDESFVFWRELFIYYPMYKYAYTKGDVLLRQKINTIHKAAVEAYKNAKKAQEEEKVEEANQFAEQQKQLLAEKEIYVDTLLMIYDRRIKFLGDAKSYGKGYLMQKKAGYIYKYRAKTHLELAYTIFKESYDIEKKNTMYNIHKDYFDVSMDMIEAEKIDAAELVKVYTITTDYLKHSTEKYNGYIDKEKKKSAPNQEKIKNWEKVVSNNDKVTDYITRKFASSEYSKCEFLIPAFKNSFEDRKNDIEWLKTATGILAFKECTEDPFYMEAAIALYNVEPSPDAAYQIAVGYLKKENYEDAGKYIEEAYTQSEDDEKKALYYYTAAVISYAQNKLSNSRSLALKAAGLKEGYGKPYVLIAKLYAAGAGSCGSDKFEQKAVYWAAVDKLIRAKNVDKSVEGEVNKLINKYSARYPNSEEGFMRGIYKGNAYKVGCWIQENTTARY